MNFVCRLCRKPHGLRNCRKFNNMNISERLEAVKKYGYCPNCLAHSHSQGSCFTRTGCMHCHEKHHSLLHVNPRLRKGMSFFSAKKSQHKLAHQSSVGNRSKKSTPSETITNKEAHSTQTDSSASTSLCAILHQNAATLLPTALVKIETKEGKRLARCLLDTASRMSWVSKKFVDKLNLTTLEMDGERICPVILWSCVDPNFKIQTTLKVNNRINTITPKKSLSESIQSHFQNLILADRKFYKSSSIDLIIGVDVYSRIILDGIFVKAGLPTAQNTSFGIILYGTFTT